MPKRNPKTPHVGTPSAAAPQSELETLQTELRHLDQQISKIAGVGRPSDASRQQRLAEKQDLLAQKVRVQAKIRSLTPRPSAR